MLSSPSPLGFLAVVVSWPLFCVSVVRQCCFPVLPLVTWFTCLRVLGLGLVFSRIPVVGRCGRFVSGSLGCSGKKRAAPSVIQWKAKTTDATEMHPVSALTWFKHELGRYKQKRPFCLLDLPVGAHALRSPGTNLWCPC
jgi:hypothetical protein